jgi:hypothetical protein
VVDRPAIRIPVTEQPTAAKATPRLALILALLATLGSYTIDAFFPSMRAMAI